MYTLPPLPYAYDALEPHVSATTLRLHHDVLQRRYVEKLNRMIGSVGADVPLETLILEAPAGPTLNNAAQVWNHTFLWSSMSPKKTDPIEGWRRGFEAAFLCHAGSMFGSGYVWIVQEADGDLGLWSGGNAQNPLRELPGATPLLCLDVWEHAYLLDYGADRIEYAKAFLRDLVNWDFARANLR